MTTHEDYMRLALDEVQRSVDEGSFPFSVIVVDPQGNVVWKDHDRVQENFDPTAHGEVNAIRKLCTELKTTSLKGYVFYTSSEPCITCLTSCIKAQVSAIYFGAQIESTASLPLKALDLAKHSKKYPIHIQGGILEKECEDQRTQLLKKTNSQ